jgi:hypothetical protein
MPHVTAPWRAQGRLAEETGQANGQWCRGPNRALVRPSEQVCHQRCQQLSSAKLPAKHAGVAQWQSSSLPSWWCGFNSRRPLPSDPSIPSIHLLSPAPSVPSLARVLPSHTLAERWRLASAPGLCRVRVKALTAGPRVGLAGVAWRLWPCPRKSPCPSTPLWLHWLSSLGTGPGRDMEATPA